MLIEPAHLWNCKHLLEQFNVMLHSPMAGARYSSIIVMFLAPPLWLYKSIEEKQLQAHDYSIELLQMRTRPDTITDES